MKKVLIFGVCGFVGKYLSKELLNNGYRVIGTDKVNISENQYIEKFYQNDLTNYEEVKKLIDEVKPDVIINLAAVSSVGVSWNIPQTTINVNVVGALNIMEAVKNSNINIKILLVGSSEEYVISNEKLNEMSSLNASNPYGISKITQESFAKLYREKFGMKIYCVRSFNHTGVGQKDTFVLPSFCKQVAELQNLGIDGMIKVGNLKVYRDFSHVKDIVKAYRMVIESNNYSKIYNIGSGQSYSLEELLRHIIKLSDRKISIVIDKNRFRPSDQPYICCDNTLIKKDLGWVPEYTVFDALNEIYESYLG